MFAELTGPGAAGMGNAAGAATGGVTDAGGPETAPGAITVGGTAGVAAFCWTAFCSAVGSTPIG